MKRVSHSEITTYLDCQKKWKLQYIDKIRTSNIHFKFGDMGHKVLYSREIPDESLYLDLKEAFSIKSWKNYFEPIFKCIDDFISEGNYEVVEKEIRLETEELVGAIDLVLQNKQSKKYLLLDYKFSTGVKKYEELLNDEQLYIYAYLFSELKGVDLNDIETGYVNIPKSQLDEPRLLNNGKLSKDKSQNTTFDLYLKKISELNLEISEYLDILDVLKTKQYVTIYKSDINLNSLCDILTNIHNVIIDMQKDYILEKFSYMCLKCDMYDICKNGGNK